MSKLTADELRDRYLKFFESKGHTIISGASVIPENDPTVLFTTAGMHPLVPYLLGEKHPAGRRLTDVQTCIRTGDIEAVGDSSHLTFFEMLGNWSLGDYFKKEAIAWSFEFLTQQLGFKKEQLSVTVFEGEEGIPFDEEAEQQWLAQGIAPDHIYRMPRSDNWWGPAGTTGPCGPDTEMFIDTGKPKCDNPKCGPGCHCGKFIEIWNDVFMQYNKTADGSYEPLKQHNVDTGMGIERTICMINGYETVYDTELFAPLMAKIRELSTITPADDARTKAERIIADHMRTATFILGDPKGGIKPGNVGANYVLRRLIRRAVRYAKELGMPTGFTATLADIVMETYRHFYSHLLEKREMIIEELTAEESRFEKTLVSGQAEFDKVATALVQHGQTQFSGRTAFKLYDTYGFPLEMTIELAQERGLTVDTQGFDAAFEKHKELSKQGEGVFKGGLADHSKQTTRLHTATHLLHKALKMVLGEHVNQKGSNITVERLRFDFSHPEKMTPEQVQKVEDIVNEQIKRALPVTCETMSIEEAKQAGATALFTAKYGEQVKVYTMGDFSKEVCGGPHVENTSELVSFKIKKEESSSAGVRRIKAVIGADPNA